MTVIHPLTSRMNSYTGDPLGVCLEFFGHFLLDQVVDPDRTLRGHKEVGPDRVEGHGLD